MSVSVIRQAMRRTARKKKEREYSHSFSHARRFYHVEKTLNLSYMLLFALFSSYLVASLQERTPIQDFPPLAEKSDCSCSLSEALLGFYPTPRRLLNPFYAGDLINFFGAFLLVLPRESCIGITDSACAKNRRNHCPMHYRSKQKRSNVSSSTIFDF